MSSICSWARLVSRVESQASAHEQLTSVKHEPGVVMRYPSSPCGPPSASAGLERGVAASGAYLSRVRSDRSFGPQVVRKLLSDDPFMDVGVWDPPSVHGRRGRHPGCASQLQLHRMPLRSLPNTRGLVTAQVGEGQYFKPLEAGESTASAIRHRRLSGPGFPHSLQASHRPCCSTTTHRTKHEGRGSADLPAECAGGSEGVPISVARTDPVRLTFWDRTRTRVLPFSYLVGLVVTSDSNGRGLPATEVMLEQDRRLLSR